MMGKKSMIPVVVISWVLIFVVLDFILLFSGGTGLSTSRLSMARMSIAYNVFLFTLYAGTFLLFFSYSIDQLLGEYIPISLAEQWLFLFVFFMGLSFTYPYLKLNFLYGLSYFNPIVIVVFSITFLVMGVVSVLIVIAGAIPIVRWLYLFTCLVLILLTVGLPWGFGYSLPAVSQEAPEKPNVLVLLVDALHAKHLNLYGYERRTAPNLTRFADRNNAAVFARAFSAAPWTRPSVATLFSGLYPTVHKTTKLTRKLPRSIPIIPEILWKNGYRTAAVTTNTNVSPYFGFGRGMEFFRGDIRLSLGQTQLARLANKIGLFETTLWESGGFIRHVGDPISKDADYVNSQATELLSKFQSSPKPFFMYLHYMDPHTPYSPPKDYLKTRKVSEDYNFKKYQQEYMAGGEPFHKIFPFYEHSMPPESVFKDLVYQYDAEIRYWDHEFGKLVRTLESSNLLRNTIVVITADHGEEFLQHGNWTHGSSLFNELIHVPFLIHLPERDYELQQETIDTRISLVDFKHTLLSLLEVSNRGGKGVPFERLLLESDSGAVSYPTRPFYAASDGTRGQNELFALITDRFKVHSISNGRQKAWRFYNYRRDYGEQTDLSDSSDSFPEFKKRLIEWRKETRRRSVRARKTELKGQVKKELEALGYME